MNIFQVIPTFIQDISTMYILDNQFIYDFPNQQNA